MKRISLILTLLAAGALPSALRSADPSGWKLPAETARLKPGPGAALAAQCLVCHSADYLSTQPVLSRAGWQGIVVKMREKYGAPIPTNSVDQIVNYLVAAYGAEMKKPASK